MTNIKLTIGFPTSYGCSAYVTIKFRKGGSKGNAEIAGLDIAGLDIDRRLRRGGHCRTGQWMTGY